MRYYLDCEFNGMGGELLSMALVREDGEALYMISKYGVRQTDIEPWVQKNVLPIMALDHETLRNNPSIRYRTDSVLSEFSYLVEAFFEEDHTYPLVITDWPDDIRYLCEVLVTGPGQMIKLPRIDFALARVDAYPTTLPGAIQHNAYWDAMALRHKLQGGG